MDAEHLVSMFKEGMAKLSGEERLKAAESVKAAIRAALFHDAAGGAGEAGCCPRCGSFRTVGKGKSRNGAWRRLCRDCGRTYGAGTGKVLGTSKLPEQTWAAYAECFVLALPLRECARRCGVGLKTAFTMRHRLIGCLQAYSPAFSAGYGCGCELDETYFRESFKGNHTKGTFSLPRPARHRGGQLHVRGLSKEQICVMSGVNDAGTVFLEVSGRGVMTRRRAFEVLEGKVCAGAIVSTDRSGIYPDALRELHVAAHRAFDSKDRSKGTINRVNAVHSLLAGFMRRFKGVSTKHLAAYLAWFRWARVFVSGASSPESTVVRQLADGRQRTRTRDMFNVLPPYMDYWRRTAA